MKIGNVSGLLIIITFFFLLNVVTNFLPYFVMFFVGLYIYKKLCYFSPENVHFTIAPKKISGKIIIRCMCIGILLSTTVWGFIALQIVLFSDFVSSQTINSWMSFASRKNETQPLAEFDWYITIIGSFIFLSQSILMGPFIEELYFRGAALQLWVKKYGYIWAVLLSSLFFVLIHPKSSLLFLSVFVHSVIYCILAIKFKHILYSFFAHASYNFSMSILNIMDVNRLVLKDNSIMNNQLLPWSNEFIIMLISMLVMAIILYQYKPNNIAQDIS